MGSRSQIGSRMQFIIIIQGQVCMLLGAKVLEPFQVAASSLREAKTLGLENGLWAGVWAQHFVLQRFEVQALIFIFS